MYDSYVQCVDAVWNFATLRKLYANFRKQVKWKNWLSFARISIKNLIYSIENTLLLKVVLSVMSPEFKVPYTLRRRSLR